MKIYMRTFITAMAMGFVLSELIHYVVSRCIGKPFFASSTALVLALIALLMCSAYEVAKQCLLTKAYKKIYTKGYNDGTKVNKYKIIIPEETDGRH